MYILPNEIINQISDAYKNDKSLSHLYALFSSHKKFVVKFIDALNLIISDDVVVDVFSDKYNGFAKARYMSMKSHIEKQMSVKFENDVISYFDNRFTDSESISETYMRLKHKIYIRPVCEECGGKVKYGGNQQNGLFQRFLQQKMFKFK